MRAETEAVEDTDADVDSTLLEEEAWMSSKVLHQIRSSLVLGSSLCLNSRVAFRVQDGFLGLRLLQALILLRTAVTFCFRLLFSMTATATYKRHGVKA